MNDDVASLTDLSRIQHCFVLADVEAALAYQFDAISAPRVAEALFSNESGGLVLEKGSAPAFAGLLLAALAHQSPEKEALVVSFLNEVATDARIAHEYNEGRQRLVANGGKSF